MKSKKNLLALVIGLFGFQAQADVWTDVNTWTPQWEKAYSEWVYYNWSVDFFARKSLPNGQSNPYYGLHVDCADTVYSMRAVFAYENKLPFVVQDPTTTGKTISNKMKRWDGKSENERVRQFLVYLYGVLSTRSLANDTYPVAISRSTVRPGTLIKTTAKNHHSWTVKQILPIGVPWLVFNSVIGAGTSLTIQQRQSWPNPDWVFEGDFSPAGTAGFRDFRQPEYINKPVWNVPGYSEEQYRIPLSKWVKTVQAKLATKSETDSQMVQRLLNTVCDGAQGRIAAVKEGVDYLAKTGGKCMDYATYDNFSTPNRDRRVFDDLMSLRQAYKEILASNNGRELSSSQIAQLNKLFPFIQSSAQSETQKMPVQTITQASVCAIQYSSSKKIDLAELKRRLFAGLISNNPHDPMEVRWGEIKGPSAKARSCQSWDLWVPSFGG